MAKAATTKINPVYIIGAILALGGVGYAVYKSTNKNNDTVDLDDNDAPAQVPAATTPVKTPVTTTTVTLNKDLWLKKGSTGNEVKQLQTWLGITADGAFGAQTETALLARKGTVTITLNNFAAAPDVNNNALPIGTWLMAAKSPRINLYDTQKTGTGYDLLTKIGDTVDYGYGAGKIIAYNTAKNKYVVEWGNIVDTLGVKYTMWVYASDVKKQ